MQTMVFTGRLAADPQISDDFGKAVFRLLEQRGTDCPSSKHLAQVWRGVNGERASSGVGF